jgi:branched-chain amino acid transport system ATP-binding protein
VPETSGGQPLLVLDGIETFYGSIQALKGVSFKVPAGSIVTLLGANGAGKSTTLKCISGLVSAARGTVSFRGQRIDALPCEAIVRLGISHVPEGRELVPELTVLENLKMGAYVRSDKRAIARALDRAQTCFPILAERRAQLAGTLSGGEQQMLAIGRALMTRPTLLCMDEPSMGLAPRLVEEVFDIIRAINEQGTTIFVIEQNVNMALSIAHRGYVLQMGEVVLAGSAQELLENPLIQKAYLGSA